jgi:hypothetical protein
LAYLGLLYVALLAMLPSLVMGPPFGQSYFFNLHWFESFGEQVWSGELYPRWLSGMWDGAGAADFFFYAPLPFYGASLLGETACIGCGSDTVYVVGFTLIHFLSGLSFLYFIKRFVPFQTAVLGAMAYLIVPFHVGHVWSARQAVGEFCAFIFLPLVVHFFIELQDGRRGGGVGLAVSVAGLCLSHLPSTITTFGLIGFATLATLVREPGNPARRGLFVLRLGWWWLVGMALAALYWLPAILLLDDVSPQHFYMEHLLWENWLFFDGKPEPSESAYGMILKRYLLLGTGLAAVSLWRGGPDKGGLAPWVVLPLATAWFFLTPLSWPVWEYAPVLEKVQFPYRFFFVFDLGLAVAFTLLLGPGDGERPRWERLAIIAALFGCMVTNYNWANRVSTWYIPEESQGWVSEARRSRFGPAEYQAATTFEKAVLIKESRKELGIFMGIPELGVAPLDAGSGRIEQEESRRFSLVFNGEAPATVTLKRFYWEHWEAVDRSDQSSIDLRAGPEYGFIQLDLPPGEHHIELRLPTQPSERLGQLISLIAVLVCVGSAAMGRRPVGKKDTEPSGS